MLYYLACSLYSSIEDIVGLIVEVDSMHILRRALVQAGQDRSPFYGCCSREWASKMAAFREDPFRNRPLEITPPEMALLGNGCPM